MRVANCWSKSTVDRMRFVAIGLVLAALFTGSVAQRPCAGRYYPGAKTNLVCVCNATYCDDVPVIGNFNDDEAVVFTSSASGARFERSILKFGALKDMPKADTSFKFNPSTQYQEILGFGAAFTDSAGINLAKLDSRLVTNIIKQYFDPVDGFNYVIGRIPMASTDFSTREYSYDDVDGDLNLVHFNLTLEDFNYKIPYIQQAMKANKNLKLFTTPWSAPGWMKTNGRMKGGAPLRGNANGPYFQTWAKYFIRFFEEYAKNGITFWATTIQNEPSSGLFPDYAWQTMFMPAAVEKEFLSELLGPALRASNVTKDIKVMIYSDQRVGMHSYVKTIMENEKAAKYVDGIAFHWYEDFLEDASALSRVHDDFPQLFLLATEACTGYLPIIRGVFLGDWSRGSQYAHSIIEDLQNWAVGWTDWNIVLDTEGGPNWVQNNVDAPIIVNSSAQEYYKQPMFYALGHFSKFVPPGSIRVKITDDSGTQPTGDIEAVAFTTSDNRNRVIVINNRIETSKTVRIEDASRAGSALTVEIEGNTLKTLIWKKV
uniref:Glucosylceramidase n=1 Tax=Panagrellus redivivus TaxID=6233 RepID=A0A7E4VSA1_PANRE